MTAFRTSTPRFALLTVLGVLFGAAVLALLTAYLFKPEMEQCQTRKVSEGTIEVRCLRR